MRPSIRAAIAASVFAAASAPWVAFADNIQDTIDEADSEAVVLTVGSGSGTASIRVIGNNADGTVTDALCNWDTGDSPLVLNVTTPTGVTATPSQLSITECGDLHEVTFTAGPGAVSGSAGIQIVSTPQGGGGYNDQVDIPIIIASSNAAPVAANDSYSTPEDTALTVPAPGVLGNDTDADSDALSAVLVSGPSSGSVTLNANGSFSYTPDANFSGSDSFTYKANDGSADSNVATVSITVTPVNDAPVVTPGAGSTSNEGDTVNVSATFVDPDGAAPYTASINWGDGHSSVGTVSGNSVTGSHAYEDDEFAGDDNYTVTISVTDSGTTNGNPDPQTGSATLTNHVNNAAPTVATPTVDVDGLSGVVSLSTTFTDPAGGNDTYSGKFVVDGADVAGTVNQGDMSMSGSITLAPGCHTIEVSAEVSDEDGGTGTSSTTEKVLDVYTVSFLAPIRDDVRNIAKYGNVVPVKVQIGSSCSPGTTITDESLFLTVAKGEFVADSVADDSAVVVTSVSNADTGTQMRVADGKYIYNLSTKTMKAGEDYTIRIRSGSTSGPVIAKALFQPKK